MSDTPLSTRVGAARFGDNLFRGHSVSHELAGKISQWELLALAVEHRTLDPDDTALLDDMVVCCIAADPRIWPLKIVRLLACYGHTTAGMLAGTYCTEGSPFGWRACGLAAEFLQQLAALAETQPLTSALALMRQGLPVVPGFGVPARSADERVVALRRCVEQRAPARREFWSLAHRVEAELGERTPLNVGGACGALLLDRGFSPAQIFALGPTLAAPNYLANAIEGAAQAPAVLQRLPTESLDDRTEAARLSPRARLKRT